jgi:hypothetical protein
MFPMPTALATIRKFERPLSALSMIAGFAFDNYYFGRVDHPATQIVLFTYLLCAIGSILLLHLIESRAAPDGIFLKAHPLFVVATQFAFGGLWSAFLIFYGRSAVIAASWPFLIVLAAMLVGNEMFRKYHARLAFAATLLFFALFSYMIFAVPLFTGTMGRRTFLVSGLLAILAFGLVLLALWAIGPERMRKAWRGIAIGAAGVFASVNFFYFTNILPPLPLALANAGVFHSVTREGNDYRAVGEPRTGYSAWYGAAGTTPVVHLGPGEPVYFYSAVFAPIQLRTNVVHVWQRYDEAARRWRTETSVSFPITGGRDGGYRGYSIKSSPRAGRWRVNITTPDGLLIGRVPFSVTPGSAATANLVQVLR